MKEKNNVTTNGRAVFYAIFWENFRKSALELGWCLSLHGSLANDMDMVAIPWVDDVRPVDELIKSLSDCIGKTIWKGHHFEPHYTKPHGRVVYTLSIFSDFYIDLSVILPNNGYTLEDKINIKSYEKYPVSLSSYDGDGVDINIENRNKYINELTNKIKTLIENE